MVGLIVGRSVYLKLISESATDSFTDIPLPGLMDISLLDILVHPEFDWKQRKSKVKVIEMLVDIYRRVSKTEVAPLSVTHLYETFRNALNRDKTKRSRSEFLEKNAVLFSSKLLVPGGGGGGRDYQVHQVRRAHQVQ